MYPIHYASIAGNKEIIDIILTKSIEEVNRLTDTFQYTPLHIAASNENLQAVLTLLIYKCKVSTSSNKNDTSNPNKNNPLHCAMRNSDLRIAQCLISYDKGYLCQYNKNNKTPLDLAQEFHNQPMVEFLTSILEFKCPILPIETLYLKYIEAKDINEKLALTENAFILSRKKKEQLAEEEEEEAQEM